MKIPVKCIEAPSAFIVVLIVMLIFNGQLFSQGTTLPLGNDAYRILNRLEIKSSIQPDYFSSLKSYTRGDAMKLVLNVDTLDIPLSNKDRSDIYYMLCENNEWLSPGLPRQTVTGKHAGYFEQLPNDTLYRFVPTSQSSNSLKSENYITNKKAIWNFFYQTPANWAQLDKEGFYLRLNPIINFKVFASGNEDENLFINQRGVELRGGIDDRIYFYSYITDSQARFPEYVNEYTNKFKSLPGNGLYKTYNSTVFDGLDGVDWLNGQAYIGMNITKNVGFQFGHGKHFIGNGYRSLLLSDFSHNYLYLKVNWKFWKFHFQNIFTEMHANSSNANPGNVFLPKKYLAAHYLGFNITPKMSIGLYEAVVFRRENGFELQYLNPVILYRTVEHLLDSEDNILLGIDYKWNINKTGQIYAQAILDEFRFDYSVLSEGWWGNKFGVQVGGKYIDAFGIDHLDLQFEYNMARPYTYSHNDSLGSNYSHYNLSLAHPLGANFQEFLGIARYQVTKRLALEARGIKAKFGEDPAGENWGSNILISNTSRQMDFGNEIGQGIATSSTLLGLDISYQLYHNILFELHYFYRKKDSDVDSRSDIDSYLGGGFRINVGKTRMDF